MPPSIREIQGFAPDYGGISRNATAAYGQLGDAFNSLANRIELRRQALVREKQNQQQLDEQHRAATVGEGFTGRNVAVGESAEGRQKAGQRVEAVQAYHAARQQGDADRAERIKQAYGLTPADVGAAPQQPAQPMQPQARPAPLTASPSQEIAGGPGRPAPITPGMDEALAGAGFTPGGDAQAQAEHDKFLRRPATEPGGDFMSEQNQQDLLAQRRQPLAPVTPSRPMRPGLPPSAEIGGMGAPRQQAQPAQQALPDLPNIGREYTSEEVRAIRNVQSFFAAQGDPELRALLPKVPGALLASDGSEEGAMKTLLALRKDDMFGAAASQRASGTADRFQSTQDRMLFMQGATLFNREAQRLGTAQTIDAHRTAVQTLARLDEAAVNPVEFAGILFGLAESNDPGSRKTNEDIRQAGGAAYMSAFDQGKAALTRFFEGERGPEQMENIRRALTNTARQSAERAASDRASLLKTRETMDDPSRTEGFDTGMEIFSRVPGSGGAGDEQEGEVWTP